MLVELKSQGHGRVDKALDLEEEDVGSKFIAKRCLTLYFWEVTLPPGAPLSSFEKEGRNPCHDLRSLSCDAGAASVKKFCICVMI